MERMRIDKWLWAARFFKTRSLAAHCCELGKVTIRGQQVKPAHDLRAGDQVLVKTPGGDFQIEVLGLSELRGPAPVAQALYRESEVSREARRVAAEERKLMRQFEGPRVMGRPTKKDRRQMTRLKAR